MNSVTYFRFFAKIYKVGINPCIDIPQHFSEALEKTNYIPVKGKVNDYSFLANLVPVRKGPYRLFLNAEMRQGAKADLGDTVEIALAYDSEPRIVPMPKALAEVLNTYPQAKKTFEGMTPSRQKEVKLYLNSLKTNEAIQRNIYKLFPQLSKKRR